MNWYFAYLFFAGRSGGSFVGRLWVLVCTVDKGVEDSALDICAESDFGL